MPAVIAALLLGLGAPGRCWRSAPTSGERLRARRRSRRGRPGTTSYDPGRERRAELKARELLRSVVGEQQYAMYRELGFIARLPAAAPDSGYGYLIYPHRPIVAFEQPQRRAAERVLRRLPGPAPSRGRRAAARRRRRARQMDGRCSGDERGLIGDANMHAPGQQLDPALRCAATCCGCGSGRDAALSRQGRGGPTRHELGRKGKSPAAPALQRRLRRPRPRPRARLHEGDRLRRRGAQPPDHRGRQHLDRGDALQLPPPRPRRRTSRTACGRPGEPRWSSTRSRSPTGSRWGPRG